MIKELAKSAKAASLLLAAESTEKKNKALEFIAVAIKEHEKDIIAANRKDLEISEQNKLAMPLRKRLKFDEKKITGVIDGINSLIALTDPVGNTISATELDHGLELYKVTGTNIYPVFKKW